MPIANSEYAKSMHIRTHHGGVITVAHQPGSLPSQAPQALGDVLLVPCGTGQVQTSRLPKIATPPLASAPKVSRLHPLPQLNRKFYEKPLPHGKKLDQLYQLLETHAPALGPRQLEMLAPCQGIIIIIIIFFFFFFSSWSSSWWCYHNPFEH